jgi:hypothetical protein
MSIAFRPKVAEEALKAAKIGRQGRGNTHIAAVDARPQDGLFFESAFNKYGSETRPP